MTTQSGSLKTKTTLDEIIDNAVGLPLETQDLLLMIAKTMKHTRDRIAKRTTEQVCRS